VVPLIGALAALAALFAILWFALLKPNIRSTAKNEVNGQLAQAGITPANSAPTGAAKSSGSGAGAGASGGASSTPTTANVAGAPNASGAATATIDGSLQAAGNGTQTLYTVPAGHTFQVTDLLVQNAAGDNGIVSLARNGNVLMQWTMATFRDLDYHWISPTLFTAGDKVQMVVSGCTNACHPGIYFAGNLVRTA
jgi:hypothetical protein